MDQRECSRTENTCASENTSGEDCALAQEDCWGNTPEGISTGGVDGFARLVGSLIGQSWFWITSNRRGHSNQDGAGQQSASRARSRGGASLSNSRAKSNSDCMPS